MKRILISAAASAVAGTVVSAVLYHVSHTPWLLTAAITLGTISYHLGIRLLVGGIVAITMHNHADYHKKWFQLSHFEQRLYSGLKVKRWKNRLPTYAPESFSKVFNRVGLLFFEINSEIGSSTQTSSFPAIMPDSLLFSFVFVVAVVCLFH